MLGLGWVDIAYEQINRCQRRGRVMLIVRVVIPQKKQPDEDRASSLFDAIIRLPQSVGVLCCLEGNLIPAHIAQEMAY